jgi:glutathione S-transferase
MITLHQYHLSPFNEKIQRMLNYKGIPFEERYWALGERKKVRALNPTGKLPALQNGERVVCDSTDVAHYIEQNFPQKPLIPSDPRLRAQVHVLEDWADESLYFYEIPRMVEHESAFLRWLLPKVVPGGIVRITGSQGIGRKSIEQLLVDVERHIAAVDGLLDGTDWLVGNQLSLADLAVYAMFQALRDADMVADMLARYPAVTAWMMRVEEHTGTRATRGD